MPLSVVYINVDGQPMSEIRGGVVTEYVHDPLGNLIATHTSAGVVTWTGEYWPYGETMISSGTKVNNWGFCAAWGYYDDGYDNSYVRRRVLRRKLARWQTVDPLWPGELSYAYAVWNPMALVDPSGEYSVSTVDCKPCGKTMLVSTQAGDQASIVVGSVSRPGGPTALLSGKQCNELVKKLYPGKQCICVNGGFFDADARNPLGKLDPCNGSPTAGIGSPKQPGGSEVTIHAGGDYLTGLSSNPPSANSARPGRTGACIDQKGQVQALIVTTGCTAANFERCAKRNCPAGTRLVHLDGGGSSQIWSSGRPLLLGNASATGKPDRRPVDNWIVICH